MELEAQPAASKQKTAAKKTVKKKTTAASKTKKKTPAKGGVLVIVESPAKAHTIGKFLGKGYRVTASQGHVRDLPQKGLGVDIENGFEPHYVVSRTRKELVSAIKSEAKLADSVLLATDPDREGEAISWHIAKVLGMDETAVCRIEFNEITKQAVTEAISNPRVINMDRVNAQQSRRILDRLVGYKISPLLWKKVRSGLSAGRVQSVALRLVCERDREIQAFQPQEYWTVHADFVELNNHKPFSAHLEKIGGKKAALKNEAETNAALEEIRKQSYVIAEVKKGTKQRKAFAPFTTSTLQQDASRKLGFSPANTMRIAQQLYEGVDIPGQGAIGLVTYIRTDSVRIAQEAIDAVRAYIEERYGKQYLPKTPNTYKNRKSAQDAHEAIRPTSLSRTPESLKQVLKPEQYRLYELIYQRFVASQMAPEVSDTVSVDIVGGAYTFRTTGSVVRFDGYRAAYKESTDTAEDEKTDALPELVEGTACDLTGANGQQHFTQPPAHYTEAALVKTLEEKGIGRPSTYATIISTILEREYIEKESKALKATELGFVVNDLMTEHFHDIVDVEFTADMETRLDAVEEGETEWRSMLADFYSPFQKALSEAETKMESMKLPDEVTDIPCEKCGAMMVIKTGRFGKFMACPNYPTCKTTKAIVEEIDVPCPQCGGRIIKKKTKTGKTCYGCEQYPGCTFFSWGRPLAEKCPKCGSLMTLNFAKNKAVYRLCSNAECGHREYGKGTK